MPIEINSNVWLELIRHNKDDLKSKVYNALDSSINNPNYSYEVYLFSETHSILTVSSEFSSNAIKEG